MVEATGARAAAVGVGAAVMVRAAAVVEAAAVEGATVVEEAVGDLNASAQTRGGNRGRFRRA